MANPNPGNWAQVRSSKLAESLSSLQLGSQLDGNELTKMATCVPISGPCAVEHRTAC
jgi:hypothetical protein